jgi:hypothetical protein
LGCANLEEVHKLVSKHKFFWRNTMRLIIAALVLFVLASTAHVQAAPAVAGEFYFVYYLDGVPYLQLAPLDKSGLATVKLSDAITSTKMVESGATYTVVGELASKQRGTVLLPGGVKLMHGEDMVCEGRLGEPVVVGFVQPHFSNIQTWSDDKRDPENPKETELRGILMEQASKYIMAPIQGDCGKLSKGSIPWATTALKLPVLAKVFTEKPRCTYCVKGTHALPDWREAKDRVRMSYVTEGVPVPKKELMDWRSELSGGWAVVWFKLGSIFCGEGPDEATILALWDKADTKRPRLVATLRDAVLGAPLLMGDLDGDKALELLIRGDAATLELILFELKDGVLMKQKNSFEAYLDCPC